MTQSGEISDTIECPLCCGAGKLKRTEILDRLGAKDFARVAQLSAEEAFRLLTQKHNHDQQGVWSRFDIELAKRTAEVRERHKDELHSAQSDRDDLTRLRQLGTCFLSGERVPRQRRPYKRRVMRNRTTPMAGERVAPVTRPLSDPKIDPCKGGDDFDQTFAGAALSESTQ